MRNRFFLWAAVLGAIDVALGAFGAHGLRSWVPAESLSGFETGVRYQMFHVLALMLVGVLEDRAPSKKLSYAGYAFVLGIVLFSGSLYLLTFLKAGGSVGLKGIGLITPLGGLFFIAGWLQLARWSVNR